MDYKKESAAKQTTSYAGPTPTSTGQSLAVLLMIGAILALGLLAILPGLLTIASLSALPWAGLALFSALGIVAEQLAVEIDVRGKTSIAAGAILGTSFLFGAPGILAAAAAWSLRAKLRARSPVYRMLFNFGNAVLTAAAASKLFHVAVGQQPEPAQFARMLIPAAAAGLVYYAVQHLLLCLIRGLTERRRP